MFERGEWKQFERHAEMIATFMNADQDEIRKTLENLKKAFSLIGNGKGPAAGFNKMKEIDRIFGKAGLNLLQPNIRGSKFLELLGPEYRTKEYYKDEKGKTKSRTVTSELDDKQTQERFNIPKFI